MDNTTPFPEISISLSSITIYLLAKIRIHFSVNTLTTNAVTMANGQDVCMNNGKLLEVVVH